MCTMRVVVVEKELFALKQTDDFSSVYGSKLEDAHSTYHRVGKA